MIKKRLFATALACLMSASIFTGCGSTAETGSAAQDGAAQGGETAQAASDNKELSGTLTFAIWDNNLNDFIEQNDMVGKFQEQYPDIEIEVEKIKDDSEYWNAMKMRASAHQLPDIMFKKPFTLS